ncbi:MAG: hypothetical protein JNL83_31495 [Myxococcales bacterium]|nr:hypothetical protein [Myxococcales bacterium]
MASPAPSPSSLEPTCLEPVCAHSLWEGVACELPDGHIGSHMRAATPGMAMLTWRSTLPTAPKAQSLRVDYLELIRASKRSA